MSGGRKQRSLRKKMTSKDQEDELADDENGDPEQQLSSVQEGRASVTKEIRDVKREMKENLSKFKDKFKEEVNKGTLKSFIVRLVMMNVHTNFRPSMCK